MRTTLALALALVIALALWAQQSPKVDVPVLPTERNQFGGRPGTFHFITNEQTMADASELQRTFAALDRLDAGMAALDSKTRERLSPDVKALRTFAMNVHASRSATAGKTAAEVEQNLNDAKGKSHCGACHGHGMMHGGGMRMGRPQSNQ